MATVGTEIPETGTVVMWDVKEIMSRPAGDMFKQTYEGWESDDTILASAWERLLELKRSHRHYEYVLDEISTNGFTKPLRASEVAGLLGLTDGHHRFAAALELGIEEVPVLVDAGYEEDSGAWPSSEFYYDDDFFQEEEPWLEKTDAPGQ